MKVLDKELLQKLYCYDLVPKEKLFRGDVYTSLRFSGVGTSVSKYWYNINTHKHILDSSLRMKGFDLLFGDEYGCFGKGTSNEELMRAHGFVEIYDAGQTTYSLIRR